MQFKPYRLFQTFWGYFALILAVFLSQAATPGLASGHPVITASNVNQIKPLSWLTRGLVYGVGWSPDDKLIAVSSSIGFWLYAADHLDQEPHLIPDTHLTWGPRVEFSPDSRLLTAGGNDGVIRVWRIADSTLTMTLDASSPQFGPVTEPPMKGISAVAFSHDSTLLASGSENGAVLVWDVVTGKLKQVFNGHQNAVDSLAFSPDDRTLASASYDSTTKLWDVATGSPLFTLKVSGSSVGYSVAFSPDGHLVATSSGSIQLWDPQTGQPLTTLSGQNNLVQTILFSGDGSILAAGTDNGPVVLWDVKTKRQRAVLNGQNLYVFQMAFNADSTALVAASSDDTIHLWDVQTHQEKVVLPNFSQGVDKLVFNTDGTLLATAGLYVDAHLWNTQTQQLVTAPNTPFDSATDHQILFSPDGHWFAEYSQAQSSIWLWDMQKSRQYGVLLQQSPIIAAIFTQNNTQLLSFSADGYLRQWTLKSLSGKAISLQSPNEPYFTNELAITFSPDSNWLTTSYVNGKSPNIDLWDTKFGKNHPTGHSGKFSQLLFSPDSSWLAAASYDKTIQIWNVASGASVVLLKLDAMAANLSFNRDASLLAFTTVDSDNSHPKLHFFDTVQQREVATFDGNFGPIAFSPDGMFIALSDGPGVVHFWGI